MARRAGKSPRWTARVQIGRTPAGATDLHTLDSFTDASIAEWQSFARAQANYQYALYFDLEAQRATRHEDIRDALRGEPPITISVENWRRLVNFKHSMSGLSPVGSLYRSGRFNIGEDVNPALFSPFPALYVAEDLETAYREYHGVPVGHKIDGLTPEELSLEDDGSWVALLLHGHVNNVFDATKVKSFRKFCSIIARFKLSDRVRNAEKAANRGPTSLIRDPRLLQDALMDPQWRVQSMHFDVPANSQVFGRLLVDAGFEGILYRSSKSHGRCLAVFTRQMANSDSRISLHDDRPVNVEYCEISAANCRQI